jgi:protein gp37
MKLGGFSFEECWNKSNEICGSIIKNRHIANLWLGVSVEDQATANVRIPYLLKTPAAIRFLSCEPLLGSIDFREIYASPYYPTIHWVIVGGESGHGSRPMHPDWVRSIKDQCLAAGVPFFFKQWGDYANTEANGVVFYEKVGKSKSGCLLDGKEHKQFPNAKSK